MEDSPPLRQGLASWHVPYVLWAIGSRLKAFWQFPIRGPCSGIAARAQFLAFYSCFTGSCCRVGIKLLHMRRPILDFFIRMSTALLRPGTWMMDGRNTRDAQY